MSEIATPEPPRITVDGRPVEARPGELVIDAAERAGVFIPRFCYHPRMDPVGMCRMCLVEVSGPRGFSLQPACYIRVSDGLEVITASPKARKAQEGVLEFLLVNHPLDCPVCDKGGECPLQDQALSHGPGESRFIEEKRHFEKPIKIGPLVLLDRERCIQCARCTRFADEVAGEAQIDFAGRGDEIEVAPFPTVPFSSYFSGNTVQICPVGALTSSPYRFRARPWDLEQVETTCTTCAVGCRVAAQSSAGELVRYLGIDSDPVNQSWLCDKGRYGFEAVGAKERIVEPLVRRQGELVPARWHEALREVVAGVRQAHGAAGEGGDGSRIGVLGGARLSNEDAYAWSRLARSVLRTDSVDAQLADGLPAELVLSLPRATIDEAAAARAVVLLTGDLREELPVLYLRLRAAARRGTRLVELSPVPTALSALAAARLAYRPGEPTAAVEALVADGAAASSGEVPWSLAELERGREAIAPEAGAQPGEGVVVVVGRPSLAEGEEAVAAAVDLLARALPAARFLPALRRGNVLGALDMGLSPGLLPGRVSLAAGGKALAASWGELPSGRGRGAAEMLEAAAAGELSMLVLLGADPLADFPDASLAQRALEAVPFVVALATHTDASNSLADVVLPIAGADERSGTTTNIEGRVSVLAQKVVPPGLAWPAWSVANELAVRLGTELGFESVERIGEEIARLAPSHRGVTPALVGSLARRDGVVVPLPATGVRIGTPAGGPGGAASPSGGGAGQRGVGALAGSPTGAGGGLGGAAPPAMRPIDPIATPGITSVEEQGAPLRAGSSPPPGPDDDGPAAGAGEGDRASGLSWRPAGEVAAPPPLLPGQLRLVVRRRLYDRGTVVASSPSLAPLAPEPELAVNPEDLAALGLAAGREVRLAGPDAEAGVGLQVRVVVDEGVPRGCGELGANLADSAGRTASVLCRAGATANDVSLEEVG